MSAKKTYTPQTVV